MLEPSPSWRGWCKASIRVGILVLYNLLMDREIQRPCLPHRCILRDVWARRKAAILVLEKGGFDLAKVIHYPLPHYEVEIVGLVQPLVERGNVEIVGIEQIVPPIRAWVHPA